MFQYKCAPITEAVIEIRFEKPLSRELIEKLHERMQHTYVSSTHLAKLDVQVDVQERQATIDEREQGYRLASKDEVDVLLITPGSMICSRLAPYNGWEKFRTCAKDNWKLWKKITGYQKIQRIGARYINRIDIPVIPDSTGEVTIRVEDYFNVYPEYPDPGMMASMSNFAMQVAGPLGTDNLKLIINTNSVPSPLLDHVSMVLDIDVSLADGVPQKNSSLWKMFEVIRIQKNRIFEESITEMTRSLFEK